MCLVANNIHFDNATCGFNQDVSKNKNTQPNTISIKYAWLGYLEVIYFVPKQSNHYELAND